MKKLKIQNEVFKMFVANYREWLDILGYAESTVYQLPIHLQEFFYYVEKQNIKKLTDIAPKTIKDYYSELKERANERTSGSLSKSYLNKHQQALKKFKEYLQNHNYEDFNVHLKNETNPTEEKLNILTQEEAKQLFKATEYSHSESRFRLRDKAILAILYSCGLRRNEAVHLDISDILFDKERVYVRKGKNYKERFIPINRRNAEILEDYIYEARPEFYQAKESEALFINHHGTRMQGMSFANRLKVIVETTENKNIIDKKITLHILRHSIATHLLQKEVPLESIKTFLGHSSLESTQIYLKHLKMKPFKDYLEEQNYSESTVNLHTKETQNFIKWCNRNSTTAIEIDYKKSLKYIKYLTRKGTTKKTINHRLRSVKIYFDYLIDEACRVDNPIENTTIKGVKRNVNYNLLEADELEDLYYSFEIDKYQEEYHKYTFKRAKVIIGLVVYQGLNTTDLGNLKIEHLQLSKGKIYVPSTKRSNARELELKPWQIMELMEYANEVRPIIQNKIGNHSEQLFNTNARFNAIVYHIFKKLKKYNQKAENIKQVRASVITNWLGQYNLRKVQYLAGHRYISSTERYLQDDLENLHEIVNNFHPIS